MIFRTAQFARASQMTVVVPGTGVLNMAIDVGEGFTRISSSR